MRRIPTFVVLLLAPAAAFAQYWPCQPMPVVYCPPCPPAQAVVNPRGPIVVPERMKEAPKVEPKSDPKPPTVTVEPDPKNGIAPVSAVNEKIEKIAPPNVPSIPLAKPKEELPKFDFLPSIDTPKEVPIQPIPKVEEKPKPPGKLPEFDLPLPKLDEKPKAPAKLPEFDIPLPDLAQPVEVKKTSTSKSSPVSTEREIEFDAYPIDGPAPSSASVKRSVNFVNKSSRDLLLTVDGHTAILPARNAIRAELPANFTWQIGGGTTRSEKVPATAPGLELVIR